MESVATGYDQGMRLPPEEHDDIRSEFGQSVALVGMTALVILVGLLIGLVL
jgi:hypothetical protein